MVRKCGEQLFSFAFKRHLAPLHIGQSLVARVASQDAAGRAETAPANSSNNSSGDPSPSDDYTQDYTEEHKHKTRVIEAALGHSGGGYDGTGSYAMSALGSGYDGGLYAGSALGSGYGGGSYAGSALGSGYTGPAVDSGFQERWSHVFMMLFAGNVLVG